MKNNKKLTMFTISSIVIMFIWMILLTIFVINIDNTHLDNGRGQAEEDSAMMGEINKLYHRVTALEEKQ